MAKIKKAVAPLGIILVDADARTHPYYGGTVDGAPVFVSQRGRAMRVPNDWVDAAIRQINQLSPGHRMMTEQAWAAEQAAAQQVEQVAGSQA